MGVFVQQFHATQLNGKIQINLLLFSGLCARWEEWWGNLKGDCQAVSWDLLYKSLDKIILMFNIPLSRLNQVPVVRSPSITSSHLNAVAPLVRINRITSDAESFYRVQTTSRVTSVVPLPKGVYKSSAAPRGVRVFSDQLSEPKKSTPTYAEPKKEGIANLSHSQLTRSKGHRLEEQRQRREIRKRETLTTTPNIRVRPPTIFDSLTKRRWERAAYKLDCWWRIRNSA